MNSRLHRFAWQLGIGAALALALVPFAVAYGQAEPLKIQVEINDGGFKCTSTGPGSPACKDTSFGGDFTITVPQGQLVDLTFSWAHLAYAQDEHAMVLSGYKAEWDMINSQNRSATRQFIADKPGTFEFKCEQHCEVHDDVVGHVVVKRGGGGEAVALTPTNLNVTPSSWVTAGEPVSLMVTLTDAKGAPVSKAEIGFYLDAELAGTKGQMLLTTAKTDANGIIFVDFKPTVEDTAANITARFEGMGVYDESQQALKIDLIAPPRSAHTEATLGIDTLRDWGPKGLAIAMVLVWSVLAFVVYQAVSVAWVGRKS